MLNVRSVACLSDALGVSIGALRRSRESVNECFRELFLIDPKKPDKPRPVLDINSTWRLCLEKLYLRLLLKRIVPSPHSHGGVRGRSIITNAGAHTESEFVFKADIANFYPTIHYSKIYELFVGRFGCSPDVASICTRLCTHRHHLALGLTTSPILADQILGRVDDRIGAACRKAKLVYTRYVDDITISGPFDLAESGFVALVREILSQDGFELNPTKSDFGRLADGVSITSLRVKGGHLDVRREYSEELERQIADAAALARDPDCFVGPYYTPNQIRGRVQFVASINPGRRFSLMRRYESVDWPRVLDAAMSHGLVATRKQVMDKLKFEENQRMLLSKSCDHSAEKPAE